ncbi:MAG: hypothetical protein L3J14_05745 [Flavobacteriaceae bacterium]|nr:hypothetical protein [Flavobacteriaceae bacterium]
MTNFSKIVLLTFMFSLISCKKEKEKKDESEVQTINFIESPTSVNSKQPFLFSNGNKLLMSWTQKINDSVHTLNFSELNNGKWTQSTEINRGDDWFVNWADFPAIAENNGNILTHFLQKSDPATFAYDIHLQLSNNNGKNWNKDFVLHTDGTKTEHGFATLIPYKKDSFFITWLDGRNTKGGHDGNGAMNIRAATVLSTGKVIDDALVDAKACDCCQTSATITPNGPIVVYRDRSDGEVRDISISRLLDGNWTTPKPVHNDNWVINGCPVNGPKAASFKNTLTVAWFTAANGVPKVNIAFSSDNGENFEKPIQIGAEKVVGRVDVALLDEKNALVSWMESTEKGAEIKVVKVSKDGTKQTPLVITSLSASRGSGFPQLEVISDTVYMAWNDVTDTTSLIKVARVSLSAFD